MVKISNSVQTLVRQNSLFLWLMHLDYDFHKVSQIVKLIWFKIHPKSQACLELTKLVLDLLLKTDNSDVIR